MFDPIRQSTLGLECSPFTPSSYIAILPLVSPMFVLSLVRKVAMYRLAGTTGRQGKIRLWIGRGLVHIPPPVHMADMCTPVTSSSWPGARSRHPDCRCKDARPPLSGD